MLLKLNPWFFQDALVGSRGDREAGAQERVLSALLTEMDGVGVHLEGLKLNCDDKRLLENDTSSDQIKDVIILVCVSWWHLKKLIEAHFIAFSFFCCRGLKLRQQSAMLVSLLSQPLIVRTWLTVRCWDLVDLTSYCMFLLRMPKRGMKYFKVLQGVCPLTTLWIFHTLLIKHCCIQVLMSPTCAKR